MISFDCSDMNLKFYGRISGWNPLLEMRHLCHCVRPRILVRSRNRIPTENNHTKIHGQVWNKLQSLQSLAGAMLGEDKEEREGSVWGSSAWGVTVRVG